MSFKCKIGLHSWDGCKCTNCGKTKDEQHEWIGCTCAKCGKAVHRWHPDSSGCVLCGKVVEIHNLIELQSINNDLNAHYLLVADIDANETKNWNNGSGFTPISPFKGVLNGNNHTISNLSINRPEENIVGLFRSLSGGTIFGLRLAAVKIKGKNIVGSLVGWNTENSKISECQSSGIVNGIGLVGGLTGNNSENSKISDSLSSCDVTGIDRVGGLVGYNSENSKISKCKSTGIISGKESIGGLVGDNYKSSISECNSSGNISGEQTIGGLVGFNAENSKISECQSTGNIFGKKNVGGLVGVNFKKSMISDCLSSSVVSGENYIGGLVGHNLTSSISECLSIGKISGKGYDVGGLVGNNSQSSSINNSFWDIQTSTEQTLTGNGTGKITSEMMRQYTYVNWDFANKWQIKEGKGYPTLSCMEVLRKSNKK